MTGYNQIWESHYFFFKINRKKKQMKIERKLVYINDHQKTFEVCVEGSAGEILAL